MVDERSDVVIVGGGVMGSAVAYFLKADPGFAGSVTVVERDPSYRFASSALSASSIRQQFSTPLNIRLSLFGIGFLRDVARHLAVDGEAPTLGLRERGYLILAGAAGLDVLARNVALQRAEGGDIALLDAPAMGARFPWLATEGVAGAGFGLSGEGWFDGPALMQAFRRKAISLGARYLAAEAVAIAHDGARVASLTLADGRRIVCGTLVNAAGPWAGRVAALAGVELPVRPRKRSVFVFRTPAALPGFPLLIDVTGAWCRPEGEGYICGISPPEHADPDATDFEVVHAEFEDTVWPALAARVPALETLRLTGSWAGHYEFNTLDHNAVIGAHPEIANLVFINGFSGHGMQQAPAAARGLAELIVQGGFRSLDLSALSFSRLLEDRPLREINIIG